MDASSTRMTNGAAVHTDCQKPQTSRHLFPKAIGRPVMCREVEEAINLPYLSVNIHLQIVPVCWVHHHGQDNADLGNSLSLLHFFMKQEPTRRLIPSSTKIVAAAYSSVFPIFAFLCSLSLYRYKSANSKNHLYDSHICVETHNKRTKKSIQNRATIIMAGTQLNIPHPFVFRPNAAYFPFILPLPFLPDIIMRFIQNLLRSQRLFPPLLEYPSLLLW